ncbi:MAG: hypothetical protein R6X18_03960 [Chloroflexota bacterium]
MTVTYTNRRGKTYYLHQGQTSKGNPKYHFAQHQEGGDLVDQIPAGHEIYENPNGQVFLRKIPAQIITAEEVAAVRDGMQRYGHLERFIIDVKKNAILVYAPDQDVDMLLEALSPLGDVMRPGVRERLESYLNYSPMLRFVLVDKANRLFQAYRFTFFSDFDDWMPIGTKGDLPALVKEYAPHLEQDSYYELY